ncbi:lipoprotein-releasing ABC transporter ATP-binding protein LolD [Catenovulum sp. SM1970]|uniref:lipoprotein-releasing ABC transporter ATP-binding protein LolD n=1 Tax=Marinifaba aquimaris TaxID=2741323 RepID=UPI001571C120|nr:lipoprotein-releasing ABC transporter ATP-binding protein LolD [Marinifaba aquimaris]NTS77655.1 lipoprotein-releasing ABC transporter ATP-binding protein LolD [Marinifaba aquimaris]
MTKPILICKNISKTFNEGDSELQVLSELSLQVGAAEHLAIVGSSGSGKSSLLHIMGALDSPSSGQVLFDGLDVHQLNEKKQAEFRNQNLGFVYQFHHLLAEFNALENVAMPLLIAGKDIKQAHNQAQSMLDRVGMTHRLTHLPAQLSGGERQRVAIARALINQPRLVLADEPTGNLDQKNAKAIFSLIDELKKELDTSFVFVTHDLELASHMDRQLKLVNGHLERE